MEDAMKKVLILALVATAGYAAWRKYSEETARRDVWSEVTDTFE